MTSGNDDADVDDPGIVGEPDWVQVAQRRYDPESNTELATEIVFAVASADDVQPTELEPSLYERVDAAALESTLFSTTVGSDAGADSVTATFRYATYLVNVRSDGHIKVYEPTGSDA